MRILLSAAALVCIVTALAVLAGGLYFTFYISDNYDSSIDVTLFDAAARGGATKIYCYNMTDRKSRTGELIELNGEQLDGNSCIYVDYYSVPQDLIDAFVAIEDKRFWDHSGVDWIRTAAASLNYMKEKSVRFGGSTITQQLIKNITGERQYSTKRKIQEIIWAQDLETKLDKTEIIELYMNIINLSQGCTGVQAAANTYFSKDVSALSLLECAAIAAITNNPGYYDPVRHPENNLERRNIILDQMLEQGYINEEEYNSSYNASLVLDMTWEQGSDGVNSWYTDMVIEDVISDLCSEYGYTRAAASMLVYSGGLRIYTAMDPDIQLVLEEYYTDTSNFPSGNGTGVFQSSMIVIDPFTGDILGVAGAIGEKTANRIQNYATQTTRPSGSSIKPLSVYAPALEAGVINSASVYDDVPVDFRLRNGKYDAWPKNSPAVYRGLTNVITAVRDSVNTVAVRVLKDLGEQKSFDFMKKSLSMDSLIEEKTLDDGSVVTDIGVASLALGQQNYGVTVRELTAGYSIFVNGGVFSKTRSYYKVTDAAGNPLLDDEYEGSAVISPETASIMTLMLKNVVYSGTAKAVTLDSYVDVAGKTGTTQDNCDKWFIGCTPYLIGGVWCGYEYPEPLSGISGNPCITVWDEIMTVLHDKYINGNEKPSGFMLSDNIVRVKCCADSGLLPTAACRTDARGNRSVWCWFASGEEPAEYCKCHVAVDYDHPAGGVACDECPSGCISKVGMIQVTRSFPVQVYVTDAQYVWRRLPSALLPGTAYNEPFFIRLLKKGEYCGTSKSGTQFNRGCPQHGFAG